MAKPATVQVKLVSTADTGFFTVDNVRFIMEWSERVSVAMTSDVEALVVPQLATGAPSRAALVTMLAMSGFASDSVAARLAVADQLASKQIRLVELDDRSGRYRTLSR